MDFSSVKAITIPEGSVSSIQIGGVTVWSSVPDVPTVSISADDTTYSYSVTLNSRNDPIKYRVMEYAPDGTCVYGGSWKSSTTNVSSSGTGLYSYTEHVTIEAYSYRDSLVSDTVSNSATPSRTPYIDMPSISLTDEGGGSVSCSISGTGTVYYSFDVYDDDDTRVGGDSGEGDYFSVTITDYTDNWGKGTANVYVSAYSEAYGITSDSDASVIYPAFA